MSLPPELKKALEANLFEELNLESMPLEEKEKFLNNIGTMINQNIALRLLEELSDEQSEELKSVIEKNPEDPEKLFMFLRTKIPNYDQAVQEEIALAKNDLIQRFGKQ